MVLGDHNWHLTRNLYFNKIAYPVAVSTNTTKAIDVGQEY